MDRTPVAHNHRPSSPHDHPTVADFGCFQTRFVAQDPYADGNEDSMLTVADFGRFRTRFAAGCP